MKAKAGIVTVRHEMLPGQTFELPLYYEDGSYKCMLDYQPPPGYAEIEFRVGGKVLSSEERQQYVDEILLTMKRKEETK